MWPGDSFTHNTSSHPSAQRNGFIKAITKVHLKLLGSPDQLVLTHCLTSLVFGFTPSRCLHTPTPEKPQKLCHPSHAAAVSLWHCRVPRVGWEEGSTFGSYWLAQGTAASSVPWHTQWMN